MLSDYDSRIGSYQQIAFQMRNALAIHAGTDLHIQQLIKKFDELQSCPHPNQLVDIVLDKQ